ncbi:hypothetical protein CLOLEP_01775 [[Clostridium] leptum DSM 753]|uniref:Uncharacterized protein n=1 Tax=[Clostridium] leptum DSM 753 TaxID=428125 RepID=A7VT85_9FIRM|nr:hypothetical protein CLOLEP_01775 [[Clostridium] leptum DSM 753]
MFLIHTISPFYLKLVENLSTIYILQSAERIKEENKKQPFG